MPDDRTLQTMVIDELMWAPNVDAARIGVAAHAGVVTLSGVVGSLAEEMAAERAAWSAPGVVEVDNRLAVAD